MSDFNTLLAVRDLMSRDIITSPASSPVADAARLIAEKNISSVVVVDGDGAIAGILTESDIVKKVVAAGKDASATQTGDVMSADVRKIAGESSIFEARRVMTDSGAKHLIVEEGGKPAGLISATALMGG